MYGVIYLLKFPDEEDPSLESLELFDTFEEAEKRTREIVAQFLEEYGDDYSKFATEKNPDAIMSNGEVVGYAFIRKADAT